VDATGIALKTLGRPITNTAILGAFCKGTSEVKLESILEAVRQQWGGRLGEANVKAVESAFENTLIDTSKIIKEPVEQVSSSNSKADWRTFKPEMDVEKCTGCRMCWIFCPEHTINMINGKSVINYNYCKGCGICAEECPTGAIYMNMERED